VKVVWGRPFRRASVSWWAASWKYVHVVASSIAVSPFTPSGRRTPRAQVLPLVSVRFECTAVGRPRFEFLEEFAIPQHVGSELNVLAFRGLDLTERHAAASVPPGSPQLRDPRNRLPGYL
jgi:hypothetical protein